MKDLYLWLIVLGSLFVVISAITGFILAKSAHGRQLNSKLVTFNALLETATKAAVSHAAQLEDATGAEKKGSAVSYALKYLTGLGFKINPQTESVIGNMIESAYQTIYKVSQYGYNVGLDTNTDDSKNDAFADKNGDGVADFLEPSTIDPLTGKVTVTSSRSAAPVTTKAPTTTEKPIETTVPVKEEAPVVLTPVSDTVADIGVNSITEG